jgi:diguanylate cyclase (GGDEF)-like protein
MLGMLKRVFTNAFFNYHDKRLLEENRVALEYQLTHDRLTGLKNHYALEQALKENFTTIFLIDIDKFHNYNELYGIEIGNLILARFGEFVDAFAKRENYEAYRIYGDGFILKSKIPLQDHEKILADVKLFLAQLAQHQIILYIASEEISVALDVTIAISMEQQYTLEKANIALKYARSEQKEFLAYYNAINREKELKETLYWRREIKEALKEERIVPLFQPIVDRDGVVLKYEVLTRLRQKEHYISPAKFLDIALKTKLYKYISREMIKKSFLRMKVVEADFSINLLFADIKDRETMQFLKEQIIKYDIGNRLILEIVESEDIKDYELLKRVIGDFRRLGVRIAIDDFGSGFSNYAYILEIAPDYLKIDGSLIKEIDSDENAYKLVSSIQILASSLGIKTIAEYIHSFAVFETTKKIGIDEFQGFYFSEPSLEVLATKKRKEKMLLQLAV